MVLDSAMPIDSIESAKYTDNKTDKSISIIEKLSNGKDEELEITNKLTIKKLIQDLDTRDREVILLRFYKDKTQMQVAKILGISQVQVSRIEKKILEQMKLKLIS